MYWGQRQKGSCGAVVPFSGLCGLLTPSPPWGQRDLKRETEGPGKGSAASLEVLTPSPFPIQASFVTAHPKGKGHLPPCPRSLGLKMDLSRPYQQQQVLLVCFLLKTLQGPEQSLPIQKASHDTTAGSELCYGQPVLPALWERPFEPTKGLQAGGQGIRPLCDQTSLGMPGGYFDPVGVQPPTSISF